MVHLRVRGRQRSRVRRLSSPDTVERRWDLVPAAFVVGGLSYDGPGGNEMPGCSVFQSQGSRNHRNTHGKESRPR